MTNVSDRLLMLEDWKEYSLRDLDIAFDVVILLITEMAGTVLEQHTGYALVVRRKAGHGVSPAVEYLLARSDGVASAGTIHPVGLRAIVYL